MDKGHPRSLDEFVGAPIRRARRTFLGLAAAACASACSHSPLLELTGQSTKDILFPGSANASLTRERVSKIPYASIAVKFGRRPPALLVLGRFDGPDLHWISSDRVAVVTRGGRLFKTAGLLANLTGMRFYDPDPVVEGTLNTIATGHKLRRSVDMQPDDRIGIRIDSTFEVAGPEKIEIVELSFETLRIVEKSKAVEIDWQFTNTYWADRKTGFVWKSVQHFVPERPPMEIEILKVAAR